MKGFFSFILVFAMSIILLEATLMSANSSLETEKTKAELIQLEQANKERTLLENNSSRIIAQKLNEEITKGNRNSISVQTGINQALLNYLQNKAFASNIFRENKGTLTLAFLNQNTSAFILEANGIIYAEWAFTSDITKIQRIYSRLGKEASVYFTIPVGYTEEIMR